MVQDYLLMILAEHILGVLQKNKEKKRKKTKGKEIDRQLVILPPTTNTCLYMDLSRH
jgi:hypothetical protein